MLDREKYRALTFSESLYEFYGTDVILQIYLGEKAGSTYYADHDHEQKMYLIGRIKDAAGPLLVIQTVLDNGRESEIVINSHGIQSISPASLERGEKSVFVKYLIETKR